MTMPPNAPFPPAVNTLVKDEADKIRELASGATVELPHAGLLGTIDVAHSRYTALTAAQTALMHSRLPGRARSLLDAETADELRLAITVINAVRVAIACTSTAAAGDAVDKVRREAAHRLEAMA
ncbi:MAG TPA: hypothetical protein PKB06_13425 [Actinotalea sp.]|nr:hypothetical protein [Actinotalea sp.]